MTHQSRSQKLRVFSLTLRREERSRREREKKKGTCCAKKMASVVKPTTPLLCRRLNRQDFPRAEIPSEEEERGEKELQCATPWRGLVATSKITRCFCDLVHRLKPGEKRKKKGGGEKGVAIEYEKTRSLRFPALGSAVLQQLPSGTREKRKRGGKKKEKRRAVVSPTPASAPTDQNKKRGGGKRTEAAILFAVGHGSPRGDRLRFQGQATRRKKKKGGEGRNCTQMGRKRGVVENFRSIATARGQRKKKKRKKRNPASSRSTPTPSNSPQDKKRKKENKGLGAKHAPVLHKIWYARPVYCIASLACPKRTKKKKKKKGKIVKSAYKAPS